MGVVLFALLGCLLLAVVFLFYFNSDFLFSSEVYLNANWAEFGSYFGGVAGPLLTCISVLLIVCTLRQQRFQLETMMDENSKHDMLLYLDKLDVQVSHLLTRKLHVGNNRYVEFGDMVMGIENPAQIHQPAYKAAMNQLLKLTAIYCEAIALYRENVDSYFVFRVHWKKADVLVDYLEANLNSLHNMAGPSLGFCRRHLEDREST